jgi:predicted transcriptional regulator
MGEQWLLGRYEHEDKIKEIKTRQRSMEDEITQLQVDILDQKEINKEQQDKTEHLERIVEDLVARIAAQEDKANMKEVAPSKSTRTQAAATPAKVAA